MSLDRISLIRPDDWHVHFRDGEALKTTVAHTARTFSRAIAMPNLAQAVTTVDAALAYRRKILAEVPDGSHFNPLMTLYLTDSTALSEIDRVADTAQVCAIKYYPAGATTNSGNGVTAMEKVMPVLERMAGHGIPLLVHGEITDPATDIFDREKLFIDQVLSPLIRELPPLRIVLEHITTRDAVAFVTEQADSIAATITVHHLLHNRNDLLSGGVRPHFYCLPVLKRDIHQQALIKAATSGNARFFLGTDSAPHGRKHKESACGCAGIYTAPAAIELYAEVFDQHSALDKLEGFSSLFGPRFYGLEPNHEQLCLQRKAWKLPAHFALADDSVVPLRGGETIQWQLCEQA